MVEYPELTATTSGALKEAEAMVKAAFKIAAGGLVALAFAAAVDTAAAREPKSLYTTIDLSACKVVQRHPDGNTFSCNGLPGYPVIYGEGDLRAFVSVGPYSAKQKRRAQDQTLGPFNTIFEGTSRRATLEWRVHGEGDKKIPHATILRYFTRNDTGRGEVLVIMHVSARETCQAGIIDALAEPEAMAMARQVADGAARTFSCTDEPVVHGKRGKSPF
jgi:hypothetical protein